MSLVATMSDVRAEIPMQRQGRGRFRRRYFWMLAALAIVAACGVTYVMTTSNWWIMPYARTILPDVVRTPDGNLRLPPPAPMKNP